MRSGGRAGALGRAGLFLLFALLASVLLTLPVELLRAGSGGTGWSLAGAFAGLVAVAFVSQWAMERWEGIPVAALGAPLDRVAPGELLRGLALGLLLMGGVVAALTAGGWLRWTPEPGGIPPLALAGSFLTLTPFLLVAALAEELLVRGYPLQKLAAHFGFWPAAAATSLLFGLLHTMNPGLGPALLDGLELAEILPILNVALAGMVLAVAWWRSYSLWFATGVHFGWNWLMGFAADLPVSGITAAEPGFGFFDTPGWRPVVEGPALVTGGAFGPEAGLPVTLASLAGILWLWRTPRLGRSLRVRALGPLPDRTGRPPGVAPVARTGADRGTGHGVEEAG